MKGRRIALAALLILASGVARSEDDPKQAETEARVARLLEEVSALHGQGKYADALSRAQEALALAEGELGPEDGATCDCLSWVGGALKALGRLQEARAANERALAISEKVHGPDDLATGAILGSLANVLLDLGDRRAARPLLERSLAIREQQLGPDHPRTAIGLVNLAMLLESDGDLRGARPLLERALGIQEKTLGPDHLDTANTLANLASILDDLGETGLAISHLQRALSVEEKALGPAHPRLALTLNALGLVYLDLGDPSRALPFMERALSIRESALGPMHPGVSKSLLNLANVLRSQGDLRRARPLIERALSIVQKARGPEHPDTGDAQRILANLLEELGDLQSALQLLESAVAVQEKALGPEHPRTAVCLVALARVLKGVGRAEESRPLLERALAIQEKVLGPVHPATALTLRKLGDTVRELGRLEEAAAIYERALALHEKTLGPDHPHTATCLNSLGVTLRALGDLDQARERLEGALKINEAILGPSHLVTAASQGNLASLLLQLGRKEEAESLLECAWTTNREALRGLLPALSSRERCTMLRAWRQNITYYLDGFPGKPERVWSAVLEWKGAALRSSADALRAPPGASDEVMRLAVGLADARAELARLALSPSPPSHGDSSVADRFHAQRDRVEGLERELVALRPDLAGQVSPGVEPADVRRALPEGSSLLDLLENDGTLHAWLLRGDGEVEFVKLGPASGVEPLAQRFREALERDDEKEWKEAGAQIRAWLEKPLAAALKDAKALYVSPDGVLATIPWGLLPDGEGFLIERLPIVCTNGGAALVLAAKTRRNEAAQGLLALGDVDYSGLDRPFPAIEQTKGEVERVAKRFQAKFAEAPSRTLLAKDASETAFRESAPKARFLHVATHGFFDTDNLRVAVASGTRGLSGKTASPLDAARQEGLDVGGWNPLLLSGLVLAPSEEGDGYLTAEELQDLDLRGVELVVLSACETGRGELAAGEGVLGLSRALAIAGARQFMLSLWKVPDAETSQLMDAFYAGLWDDSLPAEEALRRAQLAMLARDRERGVFRPSTWGAWVLTR